MKEQLTQLAGKWAKANFSTKTMRFAVEGHLEYLGEDKWKISRYNSSSVIFHTEDIMNISGDNVFLFLR